MVHLPFYVNKKNLLNLSIITKYKAIMKVLIEEDLELLPWMLEPIELRKFNEASLKLMDGIFNKIKHDYSQYGSNVSLRPVVGAIIIAIQMNGKMINMYHFRSDLEGRIGTVYVHSWENDLQKTFDIIREDGYIFNSRLKVEVISYRTLNVPQPVIGTLIAMDTNSKYYR